MLGKHRMFFFFFFLFFLYVYVNEPCIWGHRGAVLVSPGCAHPWHCHVLGPISHGGLFLGIQWGRSHLESAWVVLPHSGFFFPDCPVLGHEGLIAPIGVLSASGSEECLSKLLFSFLVFGKRKEAWRWSQAVTKWGLTPGKESWKY